MPRTRATQQTDILSQDTNAPEPPEPAASEPAPIETPSSVSNAMPVQFDFTSHDANEEEMGPVMDVLAAGMEEEAAMMPPPEVITPEELAIFLREAYKIHGLLTIPEIWIQNDPNFFNEVAYGIHPKVNEWAASIPAVAHGIKTVSAAGSWGKLIWDYATRWILTIRVMKSRAEEKRQKEQEKNGNGRVQRTSETTGTGNSTNAKNPYIVDYGAASEPNPTRDQVAPAGDMSKWIVP